MDKELQKGSIVKYNDGYLEVRAVFKETVNLGPIFQSKTTHKKVPKYKVVPAYDEWYEKWTQSETYKSM